MTGFDLDSPAKYRQRDPDDMYRRVNDLPEQIEQAWKLGTDVTMPAEYAQVRNALIVGMGGSAIGGSLLASCGADDLSIPVSVWREYGLPGYVDHDTLVIAASFSGGTEETLSAFREAHRRGARLIAITTGGTVGSLAGEWNVPTVRFQYDAQPRATLGYLFTPLLAIFQRLGFLPPQDRCVQEAIEVARHVRDKWNGDSPSAQNPAKELACSCHGKEIIVYGGGYLSEVAHRWKTQLNENSKTWAFWEEFPELDHNAIVGFEYPAELRKALLIVLLNGAHLSSRITSRMRITEQIMDERGVAHRTASAVGASRLAQMISLISLGDYVSYYLALLNGADPTTIGPIDFLKAELARIE